MKTSLHHLSQLLKVGGHGLLLPQISSAVCLHQELGAELHCCLLAGT